LSTYEDLLAVEAAFATAAGSLATVVTYYSSEAPSTYPAIMMLWTRETEEYQETGDLARVTYDWDIAVWVEITPGEDFGPSQDRLKRLVPQVLALPRSNRTLGGTVYDWSITDAGDRPVFDTERGLTEKILRLSVELEQAW
jgi:hypothetical protein